MGSRDDRLRLPVRERLTALWKAHRRARALSAASIQATEPGTASRVPEMTAKNIIERWPPGPAKTAELLIEQYGAPNEATPTKLFWYRAERWSRIEVTADEVRHDFPASHTDYLTQGGFNRSSQHLEHGGVGWDGQGSRCRRRWPGHVGSGRRTGLCERRCVRRDARSHRGLCSGSSGSDRDGNHDGRGVGWRGRVMASRGLLVSTRWRDDPAESGRADRPVPVVRRA